MKRIPNYQIDNKLAYLDEFTNYNDTIEGRRFGDTYTVRHWSTTILTYDIASHDITQLAWPFISQTTSTLIGRILRNVPREAVTKFFAYHDEHGTLPAEDRRRLARMAGVN